MNLRIKNEGKLLCMLIWFCIDKEYVIKGNFLSINCLFMIWEWMLINDLFCKNNVVYFFFFLLVKIRDSV